MYYNISRNPYSTYCKVGLEPVAPLGWLGAGPELGTLEVNSVSTSLFSAACGALAPEPSTGRDLDSDVAKIPVGPKIKKKFNASVIQIGPETTQEQSRTQANCRNQNGILMNSVQCNRISKYCICSFCSPHQDFPFLVAQAALAVLILLPSGVVINPAAHTALPRHNFGVLPA